jgi:hypothetical protein
MAVPRFDLSVNVFSLPKLDENFVRFGTRKSANLNLLLSRNCRLVLISRHWLTDACQDAMN